MRYPAKRWSAVAILMRDSTYAVLEALSNQDMGWTELRESVGLTDGGLQNVLKELLKRNIIEESFIKKEGGFSEKKYTLTKITKKEKIYEKALDLKNSLEKIGST